MVWCRKWGQMSWFTCGVWVAAGHSFEVHLRQGLCGHSWAEAWTLLVQLAHCQLGLNLPLTELLVLSKCIMATQPLDWSADTFLGLLDGISQFVRE